MLVAKGVDYGAYLRNSLRDGYACPGRLEYKNDEVWIYEFTNHPAHEAAAGVIVTSIMRALHNAWTLFSSGASPSVDNNVAQLVFEPDGYIRPLGKATPGGANDLTANVIVEVAFSEPEPHVLAKAAAWIGPGFTVQQVIVTKIGARPRRKEDHASVELRARSCREPGPGPHRFRSSGSCRCCQNAAVHQPCPAPRWCSCGNCRCNGRRARSHCH